MWKSLLRDRLLLSLLVLTLLIKVFSLNESWVETYYTYGFYPFYSRFLHTIFGWIPFSIGDILYLLAFAYGLAKIFKWIRLLVKRQMKQYLSWVLLRKFLKILLVIYLLFNISWGLNYNRLGIAYQLRLQVKPYSHAELDTLTTILQRQLNVYAEMVDTVKRMELDKNSLLFSEGIKNFDTAEKEFPFLKRGSASIKPSIYSYVGHYFGFSGYINPFTIEAQINTLEPVFTKPFVVDHEIAHQLGYGKENEASFVSYLASRHSSNIDFRYSVYYELYYNAFYEVLRNNPDTLFISQLRRNLHPRVKTDRLQEINYRLSRRNKLQPFVSDFYSGYLKLNKQPKGMATYDEVTAWLIAWARKFGWNSI